MHDHVAYPQLADKTLLVDDVASRHDPRAERTRALEGLVFGPIGLERGGVADVRAPPEVARREIVGRGVAGHVIERLLLRYVLGRAPDHGGKLHLPVDLIGDAGNLHRGAGVGKRPRRLEEMPRLEALAMR